MKAYVIDTSALIRLYVPQGLIPDGLLETIDEACQGNVIIFIPDIALAEVSNIILKKERARYITPSEADSILKEVLTLPISSIGHRELLPGAYLDARKHSLSIYDALFLHLARVKKAQLFTMDEVLHSAFKRSSSTS